MVSFWWIQSAIVTRDCASILLALQGFYFATSRAGNWAISLWQACVKRVKLTYSLTAPSPKNKNTFSILTQLFHWSVYPTLPFWPSWDISMFGESVDPLLFCSQCPSPLNIFELSRIRVDSITFVLVVGSLPISL
jgi:hypothetical protein